MTIEEIKTVLGIDVLRPNRTDLYVYLKSLYFLQELKKQRTKTSIAQDLKMHHVSLISYQRREQQHRSDPLFIYVQNAFDNFDKTQITEFVRLQKNKRYYSRSSSQESEIKLNQIKKRTNNVSVVKEVITKRPKMQEVSLALRKIKTYLNDKPLNEWSNKDCEQYYKIIGNEK